MCAFWVVSCIVYRCDYSGFSEITDSWVSGCRFAVAMHAFLQAVCGDVLACVWKLCAPPGGPPGGQGGPQHAAIQEVCMLTAEVRRRVSFTNS